MWNLRFGRFPVCTGLSSFDSSLPEHLYSETVDCVGGAMEFMCRKQSVVCVSYEERERARQSGRDRDKPPVKVPLCMCVCADRMHTSVGSKLAFT